MRVVSSDILVPTFSAAVVEKGIFDRGADRVHPAVRKTTAQGFLVRPTTGRSRLAADDRDGAVSDGTPTSRSAHGILGRPALRRDAWCLNLENVQLLVDD